MNVYPIIIVKNLLREKINYDKGYVKVRYEKDTNLTIKYIEDNVYTIRFIWDEGSLKYKEFGPFYYKKQNKPSEFSEGGSEWLIAIAHPNNPGEYANKEAYYKYFDLTNGIWYNNQKDKAGTFEIDISEDALWFNDKKIATYAAIKFYLTSCNEYTNIDNKNALGKINLDTDIKYNSIESKLRKKYENKKTNIEEDILKYMKKRKK